jgi:hypothetical protein
MPFSARRNLVFPVLVIGASLLASLLLIESAYRIQVVDFYRPELIAFNSDADLHHSSEKATLLVFGDSFSAGNESYLNSLRTQLPCLRIINSSISGSGIVQASLIAKSRIEQFRPSLLMVQIYVGNDLFDITYPTNWKTLSLIRNIYWGSSNNFRSLAFLNYRLGQVNARALAKGYRPYERQEPVYLKREEFSPDKFQNNEKLFLRADPRLVEKEILLLEDRISDFNFLVNKLQWLSSIMGPDCTLYLLVIPHSCQVSQAYLERTKRLGAKFENEILIQQTDYPFVQQLRQRVKEAVIIDPLKEFQKVEKSGVPLYLANDIHLNPNGNEVLANYVSAVLMTDYQRAECGLKK